MKLVCPRCREPMIKRGTVIIRKKVTERWYCKHCDHSTVKGLNPEDTRLVKEAVAKVLTTKLKVKSE